MSSKKSDLVLFGGTALTQQVAGKLLAMGILPVGVVSIGKEFSISYSQTPINNVKHCDMGQWAKSLKIPCLLSTDSTEINEFIKRINANIGLIVGWYHIIKPSTRKLLYKGCIGIHASLLPKLRGGAPLNWAILSGHKQTGVTMFEMTDELDDGPMYAQQTILLTPEITVSQLLEKSKEATLQLIDSNFHKIMENDLKPCQQEGQPSYSLQRIPDDGHIDWNQSALEIDRLVRAVSIPYPGAFTFFDNQKIIIWRTVLKKEHKFPQIFGIPGQIMSLKKFKTPFVVTGDGVLLVQEAEFEDGKDALPLLRTSSHRRFE